jgi:hypothetical protein
MVVWGGGAQGSVIRTGGAYDPVADVWAATTTDGAPTARSSHTAVWTGGHMIVWGGRSGTSNLATGGVYHPGLDTWTPTSTTGAPPARTAHTAVWTGSHMVIWDGAIENASRVGGLYAFDQSLDGDGDGTSECAGDCNDGNPDVHPGADEACNGFDDDCNGVVDDGFALPGEVTGLVFDDAFTLSWDPRPDAERYDVVRGSLIALLGAGGDFAAAGTSCVEDDGSDTTIEEPDAPGVGQAFLFLVRAQKACKTGSYGSGSAPEHVNRDASIASSDGACP